MWPRWGVRLFSAGGDEDGAEMVHWIAMFHRRTRRSTMRTTVLILLLVAALSAGAQAGPPRDSQVAALRALEAESGAPWQVRWHEDTGVPVLLAGRTAALAPPWREAAKGFLNRHRALFRMRDAGAEMVLFSQDQDELAARHLRFRQVHRGVRVYGGDLLVHVSDRGEVTCVNGRYWPEIDVPVRPSLSAASAVAVAEAAAAGAGQVIDPPETELVIFPRAGEYALAWRVVLRTEGPSGPARWEYLVDAQTGEVLQQFDTIRYQAHQGSGLGVLGDTKSPLEMYWYGVRYWLVDEARNIWTHSADNGTGLPGRVVSDGDDFFTDGAAVDAQYYLGVVYDYYTTIHGLNIAPSFTLRSTVHYGVNYNNAFWDGTQMVYGDGDGVTFLAFSGELDVVAHEATHGVDQYTAYLNYWFQPGALSESYADVLACCVDTDNWLVGEDVYTPFIPGDALRSLENPPLYGQPDHMDQFQHLPWWNDNGGVHTNSGIPNKAGYLLSEGGTHPYSGVTVVGIGRAKMEAIWFRTLARYLFPSARFQDAADATVAAAIDLYGDGSEAASARQAWIAIGVPPTL